MSELRTNRIVPRDGLVSTTTSAGGIIQVKHTIFTGIASRTTSSYDFDALVTSDAITPTRSDSKVLVDFHVMCSSSSTMNRLGAVITKNGSPVGVADDTGDNKTENTVCIVANDVNEPYTLSGKFLDSPATTSAVTYGIKIRTGTSSTITIQFNRQGTESNNIYIMRGTSSLTLMEISG